MRLNNTKLALPLLFALIVIQAAVTLVYSITLHYEMKTSGLDGLAFAQLLYNFLQGNGLVTTAVPPYIEQHWLGFHFSPILYVIAPIYAVFPSIKTLLFINSFAIALAALPIFFCANHILKSPWQAFLIAIFYLINPFVINAQVWDFHEIAFAPFFISMMLYALLKKNKILLIVFGALLVCVKEHYGLSIAGVGLLWAWHWRQNKFGLGFAVAGIIIFVAVLGFIMPHFSLSGAPAMMSAVSEIDRYSWLHHPFSDNSPLAAVFISALQYMFTMFLSLYFLPFRAIVWLLPGTADFATNFLSNNAMMRSVYSYHSAAVIPVLLIAFSIAVAKRYTEKTRLKRRDVFLASGVLSLAMAYGTNVLPLNQESNIWELSNPQLFYSDHDKNALDKIRIFIPPDSAISAQNNVLPHMTIRQKLYHYPEQYKDAQYVVLHTGFPYKIGYSIFGSPYSVSGEEYFAATFALLENKNWGVVFHENDWLVLKRGAVSDNAAKHAALENLRHTEAYYTALKRRVDAAP